MNCITNIDSRESKVCWTLSIFSFFKINISHFFLRGHYFSLIESLRTRRERKQGEFRLHEGGKGSLYTGGGSSRLKGVLLLSRLVGERPCSELRLQNHLWSCPRSDSATCRRATQRRCAGLRRRCFSRAWDQGRKAAPWMWMSVFTESKNQSDTKIFNN